MHKGSSFEQFDRRTLRLLPLGERVHDLDGASIQIFPDGFRLPFSHTALPILADRLVESTKQDRTVLFTCGAHVVRRGNAPLLVDLMRCGLLSHLALNGAGAIHDFELALVGKTCEFVARYISRGQFGLWEEAGRINDAAGEAYLEGMGLGEAIGRMIHEERFPHRETSLLAAGYRLRVPVTVHVVIGQDIIHQHANFDGAATGAASLTDFLILAQTLTNLEGGVYLNLGSAVMGPEVYLKALAMARNVAHQRGETIRRFTTGVFDLPDLGDDLSQEVPKDDPRYYFRPFKTILIRAVADGGQGYYVQGDLRASVPALYDQIQIRVQHG